MDPLEELQTELDELRHENAVLMGLMAGGYAYFLRQLMIGHRQGLSAIACEQAIMDALKRVLSTQHRFGYEYLPDIEAALAKMSQTTPLAFYLQHIEPSPPSQENA